MDSLGQRNSLLPPPNPNGLPINYNSVVSPPSNPRMVIGKVIRINPSTYSFVCDICLQEIPLVGEFIMHCEQQHMGTIPNHPIEYNQTNHAATTLSPISAVPQPWNSLPNGPIPQGISINQQTNGGEPTLLTSLKETFCTPTFPISDMINENNQFTATDGENVYEIYELGDEADVENFTPDRIEHILNAPAATNGDHHQSNKRKRRSAKDVDDSKKHECTQCHAKFTQKGSLRRHVKTAHPIKHYEEKEKKFICLICTKIFWKRNSTKTTIQEHIQVHIDAGETTHRKDRTPSA